MQYLWRDHSWPGRSQEATEVQGACEVMGMNRQASEVGALWEHTGGQSPGAVHACKTNAARKARLLDGRIWLHKRPPDANIDVTVQAGCQNVQIVAGEGPGDERHRVLASWHRGQHWSEYS
jgi:hypothetical protein